MSFQPSSRYAGLPTAKLAVAGGTEVIYVTRRFLPPASSLSTIATHSVAQQDRLDNVTARYLGDPELFWRVCDANEGLDPRELTSVVGRRIRIPLIQGSRG
jgi:hypothetical protein